MSMKLMSRTSWIMCWLLLNENSGSELTKERIGFTGNQKCSPEQQPKLSSEISCRNPGASTFRLLLVVRIAKLAARKLPITYLKIKKTQSHRTESTTSHISIEGQESFSFALSSTREEIRSRDVPDPGNPHRPHSLEIKGESLNASSGNEAHSIVGLFSPYL